MILKNALFEEDVPSKGVGKGHIRFAVHSSAPADVALVGFCANVTASLLFERLQAQGTNIVFTLAKDTCRTDVVARYEEDGLNLLWTPKNIEPSQLADTQERIRNKTFLIGKKDAKLEEKKEAKEVVEASKNIPDAPDHNTDAEEDYLVKQLYRIP